MKARKHFDTWTLLVMVITLVLFLVALVTTGLTHDILLEAGVFLVSVKLIFMGYHLSVSNKSIEQKLAEIQAAVHQLGRAQLPDGGLPPVGTPRAGGASSGASEVADGPTQA